VEGPGGDFKTNMLSMLALRISGERYMYLVRLDLGSRTGFRAPSLNNINILPRRQES